MASIGDGPSELAASGSRSQPAVQKTGGLGGRVVTWIKDNPIKAALVVITGVIPALLLKGAATGVSKIHRYLMQPGPKPTKPLAQELEGKYKYAHDDAHRILLSFDDAISGGDSAHHKPMIKLVLKSGETVIGRWEGRHHGSVVSSSIRLKVDGKNKDFDSVNIKDAVILPGVRMEYAPKGHEKDPFKNGSVPQGLENSGIAYNSAKGVLDIPTNKYDVRAAVGKARQSESLYTRMSESISSGNSEHIDIYQKGTTTLLYSIDVDSTSAYRHPSFTVTQHHKPTRS